ncbi:MAG: matrixin family metalloprotease [bacterium]|nr:matrixin family metalloprotease [bacterium]
MRRVLGWIVVALLLGGAGYIFRDYVRAVVLQMYARVLPCSVPITYRIGTVDPQFDLSQAQYLSAIEAAESIWEKGSKRNVFAYDQENGSVVINLVYDYRQQAIDKLKTIGITINDTQSSYDQLKTKYDAMKRSYDQKKLVLESRSADFGRAQAVYNAEVQSWNARGGASSGVYADLQRKKAELDAERAEMEMEHNTLNADVDTINALATSLNHLVSVLHLQAAKYNTIGKEAGGEFEEGVYESKLGVQTIDIYEFGDRAELVRVLAHELGHALGLEHVDVKDAIMYKLNQSTNERLTPADLGELNRVCAR